MNLLIDDHGRQIKKIRVSLTDRCNLRCHYCMPVESTFMDDEHYLKPHEYAEIIKSLCARGLQEVRLTGGEPLMRKSFTAIVEAIAALPLQKIGLTTNGILLDRYLDVLQKNRVDHLNISLDSLDEANFERITHGKHLSRVLANIARAKTMGFQIKVNVVAMKGVNDHELFNFVEWSRAQDIEVRFLELMRIGYAIKNQKSQFISADEMITQLKSRYHLQFITMPHDSTSFNYLTTCGARIGFIASESKAFCGACSRWRLSADGILRACLLKDEGISVAGESKQTLNQIFNEVLNMKPGLRPAEVTHAMNQIGG